MSGRSLPATPSNGPRNSVAATASFENSRLSPSKACAAAAFSLLRARAQRARRCGAAQSALRRCASAIGIAQRRHIAQPEIDALPRERMHHVRGIAEHQYAIGDVGLRELPAQRECDALATSA